MANVLQFTLGLATGGFVSSLKNVDKHLVGFIGGIASFGAATHGVLEAFEKGAALAGLSKMTGETVANLYKLQRGLKAVGLDSGDAGRMVYMLQRSLGGVNEEGVPTSHVFSQLGLSIDDLKKLDAPAAISTIAQSVAKLDNATAAAASGKIFGRMGAREFLQLARSSREFTKALRDNDAAAQRMQRNAQTFENIERGLERIKNKGSEFFQGIAEGIAPALEKVVESLNKIDFSQIGVQLGKVLSAFIEAFKEGKMVFLIVDTFKLAFEAIDAMADPLFTKLGVALLEAFKTPLTYLQAWFDYFSDQMLGFAIKLREFIFGGSKTTNEYRDTVDQPTRETKAALLDQIERQHQIGKLSDAEYEKRKQEANTGIGFKTDSWQDTLNQRKQKGVEFWQPGLGINELNEESNRMLKDGLQKLKGAWGDYSTIIGSLNSKGPKGKAVDLPDKGQEQMGSGYRSERTAIEKMGFVFGGGSVRDPGETTARNTTKMVTQLGELVKSVGKSGTDLPFENAHA